MRKITQNLLLGVAAIYCLFATGCNNKSADSLIEEAESTLSINQTTLQATSSQEETPETNNTEDIALDQSCVKTVKIDSEYIKQNLIGDSSERNIYIYLPKNYTEDGAPMPVVYFLHGLDDNSWQFALRAQQELDKVFDGSVDEFIMVCLDGNNITGGSFYQNSPSSGNWEDFITKEVVGYVDNNFNTIKNSASRCITGYSMGGYGALNLALNYTDVFGSLLVFCPGVYADGHLDDMWQSWAGWNDVKISYGQAFSPNNDSDKHFGNVPEFSGTEEDNKIVADWDRGYGCWSDKVAAYKEAGALLTGIQINYSNADQFKWIPEGCVFLADCFEKQDIQCETNIFEGGHIVPVNGLTDYLIPFTAKYLSFK